MMPPSTILELLRLRIEGVFQGGAQLITDYSGMCLCNLPDSGVFVVSGDYYWNDLPSEGKQLQVRLLAEWDRLENLIKVFTLNLPRGAQQELNSSFRDVRKAIAQEGPHFWGNRQIAVLGLRKALDEVLAVLSEYYGGATGTVLVIPDTNALLSNPDMENWRFDDLSCYEFVLTPTVLCELDDHKVNHKNEAVRDKAEKVIKRIKGYRHRGSLHEGVHLVNGVVSLRAVAVEPDMSKTLSWFDASNADDRFLATSLQIIRENMGHCVIIVTRDINMQSKAEFAGIPFLEPPPTRESEGSR